MSHADALQRILQFAPDGVVKFDYTGLLPSFNFLRRDTMPETLARRDTLWKDVEAQLIVNDAPVRAGRKGVKSLTSANR